MKTIIEPFKIKVVEPIPFLDKKTRRKIIAEAKYNPFKIPSKYVTIDLLTDSGTGAMSTAQWAGIISGDESYAGARSFYKFEEAVKSTFGYKHVLPTHQGRAAERLLAQAIIKKGDIIPGNTHFDTTQANIEISGATALNLPCKESKDLSSDYPFKGNIDTDALREVLEENRDRVPFVLLTITNNSGGGQPVSMANIKVTSAICKEFGIPLLFDAARFAENAYFIKLRENGYSDKSPLEIAREIFSYGDGALMSMKKDAFGNIGGLITLNSDEWIEKIRNLLILTEGFPTYGGLAGRDLEALAIGLQEIVDEEYLKYRIASTSYLGKHLDSLGIPVVKPFGGHAVYIDARSFLDHLANEQLPGWSLTVAMYEEIGVRCCEIGNVMFGKVVNGKYIWPDKDLVRLAIPRRVYTQSHVDYVIEGVAALAEQKDRIKGLSFSYRPEVLPHFTAEFTKVGVW